MNIYAGTDTAGIFRTTDNGVSWSDVNDGLTKNPLDTTKYISITSFIPKNAILFAGSSGNGVFLSTNNGSNWAEINTGLTNTNIKSLEVCGTNLFAGTEGGGVWRRPLSEMTSVPAEGGSNDLPTHFNLRQNYPNPFNPSTTIRFSLPSKSFVTLKVFDLIGREVATLVSEEMSAGSYFKQWNAANMSSGIYFYHLHSGTFTETKKLVLLR